MFVEKNTFSDVGWKKTLKKHRNQSNFLLKGIIQLFELGGETRLIRSAVKYWKPGKFVKNFLMIQSHERSIKPFSEA
jgi:hypothetical protein